MVTRHPEFKGIKEHVWEGLNQFGQSIPVIESYDGKIILGDSKNQKSKNKPIWHNKRSLDNFVASQLGLNIKDYGPDMSKNALYKQVANEISTLRKAKILIDWKYQPKRNTGMGVWRLDKSKLDTYVQKKAIIEMRNRNYGASGSFTCIWTRNKQSIFKATLEQQYEKCAFCKFRLKHHMVGAHIVPYSIMVKEEPNNSMNPTNGLLLCKLCDIAFERGSITVQKDMGIIVSDYLHDQRHDTIKSWIKSVQPEIILPKDTIYHPDPRYLQWKQKLNKVSIQ